MQQIKQLYLHKDVKPIYLIGINYWPRKTGPLMWRKWDPKDVKEELKQMKGLGMNVCRSFLFWPDFMPNPNQVDKTMLNRFKQFTDICESIGIYTIPSLFVGHMSGEDWDVRWRRGKNFYSDPWMLEQEIFYVQTVVSKVKNSKAIVGWLLSNEISNYAGTADVGTVTAWIKAMCDAIRKVDASRPISVGDGVWGADVYGKNMGFSLRAQKDIIDFFGPHIYLIEDDALRHAYLHSFIIKMCDYGKPVLLQEFGCSNCYASEEHQADYYRTVYHSAFLAGASGTLGWCYSDFDLPYQQPYSHHAHELLFGVTRADGSVKPAGLEVRRFNKIMNQIDLSKIEMLESRTNIVISSYYFLDYPYSYDNKDTMRKVLLQTYTLTQQAHINCGLLREPPLPKEIESKERPKISPSIRLLLAPNTQKLTAPFWESIYRWVELGGVFYCSFHIDMWIHIFEKLFGTKHKLRFGLIDLPSGDELEIKFTSDFVDIKRGERFIYKVNGEFHEKAFCPVEPTTAKVIAFDNEGRPALLVNSIGKGTVVFATYPIEYYLANTPNVSESDSTYRIYRCLGKLAGISPMFDTPNPFVQLGIVKLKNKSLLLWIINHSWNKVTDCITTKLDITKVNDFETGEPINFKDCIAFELEKKQVKVLEIKTS